MRTVQTSAQYCSRPVAGAFSSRRSAANRPASGKKVNRLSRPHACTESVRHTSHATHAVPHLLDGGSGNNGNTPTRPTTFGGSGGSGGPSSSLLLSLLCTLCGLAVASPAHARVDTAKAKQAPVPEATSPIDAYVEQLWTLIGPTVSRLGFSGLLGMTAASALKWIGRTLIVLAGLAFLLVQSMSQSGMIEVRWAEVNKRILRWLNFDPNGVTGDNVKRLIKNGMHMISGGVPDVAGFLVGFTLGLRML